MTKDEIIKELDKLGNTLYSKFGTDSYLERCTIHDLKTKIKALIIADVSVALPAERFDAEEFLNKKDIWNHPIISDRNNINGYEVADLMAEFANRYNSNER